MSLAIAAPASAYSVPSNNSRPGWYTLGTYFESGVCLSEMRDFASRPQYTAYWNYSTCTNAYGNFWALISYKYR
ncbi:MULTISPECIES: hypothetical protein [unclassified Micromonospora]|uniref:hypothetical protein n=1 Tax=unclassified Micromonospora TaxID=2617518 RepID=UPI002491C9C5|nr:hypothetical protein [Micromonospora sp. AKA38]